MVHQATETPTAAAARPPKTRRTKGALPPGIRKRGDYQFEVSVRRTGFPRQTKTFETLDEAKIWQRDQLCAMDKGTFVDRRVLKGVTLGDALGRYMEKVVPTKAKGGQRNERNRIRLLLKHPLALRSMTSLTSADFCDYRDKRVGQVGSTNTVRLELALLSHLYSKAIKEWKWPLVHALKDVTKPSRPEDRERRLEGDEEKRLLAGAEHDKVRHPLYLKACIRLAIQTGMRACELLTMEWPQVDLDVGVVRLTMAKNGSKRNVGLTLAAVEELARLPRQGTRVIKEYYETGKLDCDFKAACVSQGIENLHFHDLRHEAASRFAPYMPAQKLAKLMGWKSLQMAMRYYNPTDEEMADTVREIEARNSDTKPVPPKPPIPAPPPAPPLVSHSGNVIQVNFRKAA